MKQYLDYLRNRIDTVHWSQQPQALAEYNRALAFSERHGLTES